MPFAEGSVRLCLAIVIQAIKDAQDGELEAKDWLKTTGVIWLENMGLELDPERFEVWLVAGCPGNFTQ